MNLYSQFRLQTNGDTLAIFALTRVFVSLSQPFCLVIHLSGINHDPLGHSQIILLYPKFSKRCRMSQWIRKIDDSYDSEARIHSHTLVNDYLAHVI